MPFWSRSPLVFQINEPFLGFFSASGVRGHWTMTDFHSTSISQVVFDAESGLNESLLAPILKEWAADLGPRIFRSRHCVVVIPESQVYSHLFYLSSDFDSSRLKSVVESKIKETIPLDFQTLDYRFFHYKIANVMVVFVVAVSRELLQSYRSLLRSVDLKVSAFELESVGLLRALSDPTLFQNGKLLVIFQEGHGQWFLLWRGLIFDGHAFQFSKDDLEVGLMKDLKDSLEFFKEKTRLSVDSIKAISLMDSLDKEAMHFKDLKLPLDWLDLSAIDLNRDKNPFLAGLGVLMPSIDSKSLSLDGGFDQLRFN